VPEVNGDGSQPVSRGALGMEASLTVPGATLRIDLSGTRFMDSSGMDVLLRPRRHLATIGSTILLRSPHERVAKLLQVSGLDRVFPIELERGPKESGHDLGEPGEHEGQPPG
jgi:anti-anti-sigma regulatory factor